MTDVNKDVLAEKQAKLDLTLVPARALENVARVLNFGASKHGAYTWREYPPLDYVRAIRRHLNALEQGHWYDNETGLPHVSHIACSCLFLDEIEENRPQRIQEMYDILLWDKEEDFKRI